MANLFTRKALSKADQQARQSVPRGPVFISGGVARGPIRGLDAGGGVRPIEVDENGNLRVDLVSGVSVSTVIDQTTSLLVNQLSGSAWSIASPNSLIVDQLSGSTWSTQPLFYNGTSNVQPRADASTNAVQVINYEHHEVHAGTFFHAHHNAVSKNDGDKTNIYFKTPDTTKYAHILMDWSASGAAYGRILETPTVTGSTGGSVVVKNADRNSTNPSAVISNAEGTTLGTANYYSTDVTISSGTEVWESYSGAAKTDSGADRGNHEIILKRNTEYVFEVESDAAGISLNINLDWYEHTAIA